MKMRPPHHSASCCSENMYCLTFGTRLSKAGQREGTRLVSICCPAQNQVKNQVHFPVHNPVHSPQSRYCTYPFCLCNNSKCCLPSFASPSSCTVLLILLVRLAHNCMYYITKRWAHFRGKSSLCNNFIQKRGVGLLLRVGLFSRDYGYLNNVSSGL